MRCVKKSPVGPPVVHRQTVSAPRGSPDRTREGRDGYVGNGDSGIFLHLRDAVNVIIHLGFSGFSATAHPRASSTPTHGPELGSTCVKDTAPCHSGCVPRKFLKLGGNSNWGRVPLVGRDCRVSAKSAGLEACGTALSARRPTLCRQARPRWCILLWFYVRFFCQVPDGYTSLEQVLENRT
jgi:hypothetical protein